MADPYLSPEQVKARGGSAFPDADDGTIADLVAEFEEIAERYRGVAYVPREATETFHSCHSALLLSHTFIRSVESLTADGTEIDVATLVIDAPTGYITPATSLQSPIVITYEHGLDSPPKTILRACAGYVASVLRSERSSQSRDVIAQSFDGGITRYATPNWDEGRPTGWLEWDRLLNSMPDYRGVGVG